MEWIIKKIKARDNSRGMKNVVNIVEWELQKTLNGKTASITGSIQIPAPLNEESFLDSSQLTNEIIKQWLNDLHTVGQKSLFNNILDKQINDNNKSELILSK